MADVPLSQSVALSERERYTLATFFSVSYKPKSKAERKAMRLVFKRLNLDEIVDRLRKPGGIVYTMLSDVPKVVEVNRETLEWVAANLNNAESQTAESLILSEIEERFDDVKAGTYELPAELQSTGAA